MNIQGLNKSYTLQIAGFTLIETVIALALLSIVISTSAPYFSQIMDKNRNKAQSTQLHLSLSLARTFAITNIVDVVICPAKTSLRQQCRENLQRNTNWQFGWLVFADQNRDAQLNSDEKILQSHVLLEHQAVVFNQNGRLRFFPDGSARSAGFYICNTSASSERYIRILHTGRTRISTELSEIQATRCLSTING